MRRNTGRGRRLVQAASFTAVRCVQVIGIEGIAQAVESVQDRDGHVQAACHVFGHAWALIRPDGYLAATGEAIDASLVQAIEQSLSLSGAAQEDAV